MRVIAAVAIAAVLGAGCSSDGGGDKEILLEPAATPGPDAFATTIKHEAAPTTVAATVPTTAVSGATVRRATGTAPGLYGGTQNIGSCDVDQMVAFLAADPGKATAWAASQNIAVPDLSSYLKGLTPVVLRVDARVTNNGFANGKATPRQAVLQAGTAVLVDAKGVPHAKCACGNPLQPPDGGTGDYKGDAWSGFKAGAVVAVSPGPTEVKEFTLTDPAGQQFTRPVGGDGTTDAVPAAFPDDVVYTGTGSQALPPFDMTVPFAISSTYKLTMAGSYVVPPPAAGQTDSVLQHPGHYEIAIEAPANAAWKVVVHPAGPKVKEASGRGDTSIGTFATPATVLVDFQASGPAGDTYLSGKPGLISNFTVTEGINLAELAVADHKNAGWTLIVWTTPRGCSPNNRTEGSVQCATLTP